MKKRNLLLVLILSFVCSSTVYATEPLSEQGTNPEEIVVENPEETGEEEQLQELGKLHCHVSAVGKNEG